MHTEKLLINRLTVTLPPNRTRRMLTLSPLSIHLKTPGTLHWPPEKNPPAKRAADARDRPPVTLSGSPTTSDTAATLFVCDSTQSCYTLSMGFPLLHALQMKFHPISFSLSLSLSLSLSAHWVTESVAKLSPFQPDQTFLPPYAMPWLLPACG